MPVNQTRNFSRYPQIPSGYIDSPRKVCPGVAMHVASWCWRNGVINQINWQRLKHVPSKWAVSVKGMMMWIETGTILDTADAVWLLHIGHQTWACFRGNHRLSTQSGNLAHQASTGLRNWGDGLLFLSATVPLPWSTVNSIHMFQSMYYYHCHRRPQWYLALDFSDRSILLFCLPNAIFELRIHLHLPCSPFSSIESPLAKADIELTSHGEHLIVSGISHPCAGAGIRHVYGDSCCDNC